MVFGSIFALAISKMQGYDIWFHLMTGKYILAAGSIPFHDPFSYTAVNPWIAHEWLAGLLYFLVYKVSSIPGLIIFNAALITLYLYFVFLVARGRSSPLTALSIVYLSALAIRGAERFFVRPDVFTLFFVSLYLYLFHLFRNGRKRAVYFIPALQLLWSNLHGGGSIIGLVLLFFFLAGEALEIAGREGQPSEMLKDKGIRAICLVFICSALLVFVNPYGWRSALYFTHSQGREFGALLEWRVTGIADFLGPFGVLLIVSVLSIAVFYKRISFSGLLTYIFFAYLSTRAIRFIPLAVIAGAPIASLGLNEFFGFLGNRYAALRKVPKTAASFCMAGIFLAMTFWIFFAQAHKYGAPYKFGLGIYNDFYPVDAVSFVERNRLQGNMFNNYGFGGYLIWRFYPERKVFVDGRFDIYGEEFIAKYRRFGFGPVWDELMGEYDFSYALLDNEPSYICRDLDSRKDWALVFWDDRSLIYLRDIPRNKRAIDEYRYKYLRPNDRDYAYLDKYIGSPRDLPLLVNELNRSFENGRESLNARLMLAHVYARVGEVKSAISEYNRILEVIPEWDEIRRRIEVLRTFEGK